MKALILVFLTSCVLTARPIDIIEPLPIYCQPLSIDVQRCRDANGEPWRCIFANGRWDCRLERW